VSPLTFVSSAYVPVDMLPSWLQPLAEHQPITYMVDTVRALCLGGGGQGVLGHSAGYYLVPSLLWSAALVAVFGVAAVMRYRRG
jgi:ABC-type multidrug transport system permease subunit